MLIIDGDYPMSYGAIEKQRDLTLPIDQVRARSRPTVSLHSRFVSWQGRDWSPLEESAVLAGAFPAAAGHRPH